MSVATWRADTNRLLQSGGVSVEIHSSTFEYSDIPVSLTSSSSLIQTSTVMIFQKRGSFTKDPLGDIAEATHSIMCSWSATISVGNLIFESGETDYYEVLSVASFEDHQELMAKKVENR